MVTLSRPATCSCPAPGLCCGRCGVHRGDDQWYWHRSGRAAGNRVTYCKPCHKEIGATKPPRVGSWGKYSAANPEKVRDSRLRCSYGITAKRWDELFDSQGGRCAICGTTDPGGLGPLRVDHDHACCAGSKACGQCVRGLLCASCNTMLGMAKDNPRNLLSAIAYLEGHANA